MSIVKEVGLSVIISFFLSLQKNKMLMKQVPYNNPCNVKIVCVCVCVERGGGSDKHSSSTCICNMYSLSKLVSLKLKRGEISQYKWNDQNVLMGFNILTFCVYVLTVCIVSVNISLKIWTGEMSEWSLQIEYFEKHNLYICTCRTYLR